MNEAEKALAIRRMSEMDEDARRFVFGVMIGLTAKQERRDADRVGEREGTAAGGAGAVPREEEAG